MTFKIYSPRLETVSTLIKKPAAQSVTVKNLLRVFYFALLPALFFYVISLTIMNVNGFDIMQVIRDPAQQMEYHGFLGFLSNMGIWLWISSAAISFFAVRTGEFETGDKRRKLLVLTLILSLMLGIDDLFMIHDFYIRQRYCYLTYALFAAYMVLTQYKLILKIEAIAFSLMILFFGLSIFVDMIQMVLPLKYEYTQALEEGCKFLGMASWLYFVFRLAAYKSKPESSKSLIP